MYRLLIIKRTVEDIFIYPFILTGRLIAFFYPIKKEFKTYYFFPFYHTGGAEKVHAQIAGAKGGADCIIFFTRKSTDNRFLSVFENSGCEIRDISSFTDNKWLYFLNLIWRGVISGYINRQKEFPVVFNGQCNFGYKLSPWLSNKIKQVELIHSLNSFSYIRIPFIPFISETVMISQKRIEDHLDLYKKYKIPGIYGKRIRHIPNAIDCKPVIAEKQETFSVLFVGRNSPEKRVHLFLETAKKTREKASAIRFVVVGDMPAALIRSAGENVFFHGNINDESILERIYRDSHVLMLCSSTEGFPLVVMEAMANGCAILATPVGDIPYHVKNRENGFLFSSVTDEKMIIKEAETYILKLAGDQQLADSISESNRNHAARNFAIGNFNHAYRNVLHPTKTK